jgi:glycosyltransferase involved in cell wall biosynthesis
MKKLNILIPQYNESEKDISTLLDSIAIQQNINFNDIGVIICNDGSDVLLSDEFLKSYLFDIQYFKEPHKGVSATRNFLLDKSDSEYVMFCDADDMFYNACGLWILFREFERGGFDTLVSVFVEETKDANGNVMYITHDIDSTFVHGKVHRKKYLIDNNIRFNNYLTIHEDSYFVLLTQNCTDPSNVKYCPTPFYLWKWRDNSVCRHDSKYILKTYTNMIDSNDALIDEFVKREMIEIANVYVGMMILDTYYTFNKIDWINQENKEYRDKTEIHFSEYYKKRKDMWEKLSNEEKMELSDSIRQKSVREGMLMENITLDDWLKKIESLN